MRFPPLPQVGKIYSFNEGNYGLWDDSVKAYMDSLKDPAKWGGKPYSVRQGRDAAGWTEHFPRFVTQGRKEGKIEGGTGCLERSLASATPGG